VSLGILDPAAMRPIDLRMHGYHFSVASERRDFGLVCLERDWKIDRTVTPVRPFPTRGELTARGKVSG
jgi:hypothetical protein